MVINLCNCIDNACEKLKNNFGYETAEFKHKACLIDGGLAYFSEFDVTEKVKLKKVDGYKIKKKKQRVLWSYCPLCGEKLESN